LGVYIHYNGRSAEPEKLPELLDRLESMARAFGWKTTRILREISGLTPLRLDFVNGRSTINGVRLVEDRVIGLVFNTGEAGSFEIAFNQEGTVGDYKEISHLLRESEGNGERCWHHSPLWACVTGFPSVHRDICTMLRHIERSHRFEVWEVDDCTDYYSTGDEQQLLEEHLLLGSFKRLLNNPENAKAFLVAAGVVLNEAEALPIEPTPPPRKPRARSVRGSRPN
jgi:hypothetical protein